MAGESMNLKVGTYLNILGSLLSIKKILNKFPYI